MRMSRPKQWSCRDDLFGALWWNDVSTERFYDRPRIDSKVKSTLTEYVILVQ